MIDPAHRLSTKSQHSSSSRESGNNLCRIPTQDGADEAQDSGDFSAHFEAILLDDPLGYLIHKVIAIFTRSRSGATRPSSPPTVGVEV